MKGYFTRLIGQTGIKVGSGPPAAGIKERETPRPIHLEEISTVDPLSHEPPKKPPWTLGEDARDSGGWEENNEYLNTEDVERESPEKREKNQETPNNRPRHNDTPHWEEPGRRQTGQAVVREPGLETIRSP